jgi:hypothetical protein
MKSGICGGDVARKLEGYEGLETYSLGRRGREVGEYILLFTKLDMLVLGFTVEAADSS